MKASLAHLPARRANRGFALLITVVLLAFVVVLLVGLAAYTRIETAAAGNSQRQAQARENALLALNVALGQLQKHAGPDARVTATAASQIGVNPMKQYYTGVWQTTGEPTAATWLVSGIERGEPDDPNANIPAVRQIELVGARSAGVANSVVATAQDIRAPDGASNNGGVVGRYAWWIGDQGVKASLGFPDRRSEVAGPAFAQEMNDVLRAQLPGPPTLFGGFVAGGRRGGFDPLAPGNATKIPNALSRGQLTFMAPITGGVPMTTFLPAEYHGITGRTFGVLASTRSDPVDSGLKRDLSLAPDLLGPAFAAYANYSGYMEAPADGGAVIPPITSPSSARRRYRITAPIASASNPPIAFGVAPVLTDFVLHLDVTGTAARSISAWLYVGLWNPYTSALVPEDLTLEIVGLPQVTLTSASASVTVSLQSVLPATLTLPFTGTRADRTSWLPGRLYAWTTASPATSTLRFYSKSQIGAGRWTLPAGITGSVSVNAPSLDAGTIRIRLSNGNGTRLAEYVLPAYDGFTASNDLGFAYGARLRQVSSQDNDRGWLVTPGLDPRALNLGPLAWGPFNPALGFAPASYSSAVDTRAGLAHFLLFREMGSDLEALTADNDVPLFELPRQPVLSLAQLQHVQVEGARPFSVGNPWAPDGINAVFDRYFFSGVSAADPPETMLSQPLPNVRLVPVDSVRTDRLQPLAVRDLQQAGGLSAQHVLNAGAFNINSTNVAGWRAMFASQRFPGGWSRAVIDRNDPVTDVTGTQTDRDPPVIGESFADDNLDTSSNAAGFAVFRFPQSAQETFDAAPLPDPVAPSRVPFRRGVRGGDSIDVPLAHFNQRDVDDLAAAIAQKVGVKLRDSGPFRTLEEFLGPSPLFGGRSLLEDAIADTELNSPSIAIKPSYDTTDTGFCSLTLTQADLLGLLAPAMQPRSDTFVIRAYGEVLNPTTQAAEGRAWCEAEVQRLPAPVELGDDVAQPSGPLGRRFKVISFRWLTQSDI